MLKSLRKALATYAQGGKENPTDPLIDEEKALLEYEAAIDKVRAHLASVNFDLDVLIRAREGSESWQALLDAQNAVSKSAESKKTFLVLAEDVADRFRGLFPHSGLFAYEPQDSAISALYNLLQKPRPKVDITAIMQDIRGVIDAALEVAPKNQINSSPKQYDLSGIDFERLRIEFEKSPYKAKTILDLQERIEARLEAMLKLNPTRIDLLKRYQEIIAEYNQDKDDAEIQRVFEELFKTHEALNEEEKRYIREGFKDDKALAVFDLLSKDVDAITKSDITKLKKVAQDLMDAIVQHQQVLGNLRDRASSQAQMKAAIIDQLLAGMPDDFSNEDIEARADVVFQYVQQLQFSTLH